MRKRLEGLIKQAWHSFKRAYGPLVKSVVEVTIEFVGFILLIKLSRILLTALVPEEIACDNVLDCVHAGALVIVWGGTVVAFVFYGVYYSIFRFRARSRQLRQHFLRGDIEERVKAIESKQPEIETKLAYNQALTYALTAISYGAFSERFTALAELDRVRDLLGDAAKIDRRLNFRIGHLLALLERNEDGLERMGTFIAEKERRGEHDVDLADAYYNRAVHGFHEALSRDGTEAAIFKKNAYDDLATAVQKSPANRRDAAQDKDFECVWNEEQFIALTKTKDPA